MENNAARAPATPAPATEDPKESPLPNLLIVEEGGESVKREDEATICIAVGMSGSEMVMQIEDIIEGSFNDILERIRATVAAPPAKTLFQYTYTQFLQQSLVQRLQQERLDQMEEECTAQNWKSPCFDEQDWETRVVVEDRNGIPVETPFSIPCESFPVTVFLKLDASVSLSALGSVIDSVEALLAAHAEGNKVYATFSKDVDAMSLAEVADEVACSDDEYKGHEFTLLKLPPGSTARGIANYLWENQVLLTSDQTQTLFDKLLCKLGSGTKVRSELLVALHSFCVHQHHIWEEDDGMDRCLWANMTWGGHSEKNRRVTRGLGAVLTTSPDNWPSTDRCHLRAVAKAARAQKAIPLESMVFVCGYNGVSNWQKLP